MIIADTTEGQYRVIVSKDSGSAFHVEVRHIEHDYIFLEGVMIFRKKTMLEKRLHKVLRQIGAYESATIVIKDQLNALCNEFNKLEALVLKQNQLSEPDKL